MAQAQQRLSGARGPSPFDTPAEAQQCKPVLNTGLTLPKLVVLGAVIYLCFAVVMVAGLIRLNQIVSREKAKTQGSVRGNGSVNANGSANGNVKRSERRGTLLVVLGSGGHTSEMLSILHGLGPAYIRERFARRVYVVSSGDGFSAERARAFERETMGAQHAEKHSSALSEKAVAKGSGEECRSYQVMTVRRARNIHQHILSTPLSALLCLWDCIAVLRSSRSVSGGWPDLILTNGPGTGVCVVLASILLRFFGLARSTDGGGEMRTVYIESWARVKTLSLSGRILRFVVDRFCVQWAGLARAYDRKREDDLGKRVEFVGGVSL